ncbi:MAG TPA: hypothetical protein V6D12_08830 [Candidatus Obscuribacterales bacterium]
MKKSKQFAQLSLACLMTISAGFSAGMEIAEAKPPSWAPATGYRCHRGENVTNASNRNCNQVTRTDDDKTENERDTDGDRNKKPHPHQQRNQQATGDRNKKPHPHQQRNQQATGDRNNRPNQRHQGKKAKHQKHQGAATVNSNGVEIQPQHN